MESDLERVTSALTGRYVIERVLGHGGMATVYLARDVKHDRPVAVKVLRPDLSQSLGAARFLQEIRVAARLNHPHIVTLIDSGNEDGVLFYVMPVVDGESLRQRVEREKRLAIDDAMMIVKQVAAALEHAHRGGVIHRDIKPENILFHEGEALVTDFGIALALHAATDRLTQTGVALGTPAYMSPEQAAGEDDIDARTDVYSLACVMYEMLTGEPPYTGSSGRSILAKVLADAPPSARRLRRSVPESVDLALQRAMAKTAGDRFPTVADFIAAMSQQAPSSPARQSVAVLPFANLSPDPDNEYFADGITDDLIAQVARIGSLKVISRTSVSRFKRTDRSIGDIAAELGVATIVEGSVRRAGSRVRIVAQLIDAATDAHLWSETYDRDLEDVFAVQSDVAINIARALEAKLTSHDKQLIERKPTDDIVAYDLYLLGRHHLNKRNDEGLKCAIQYFDQAIARDPKYAAAFAALAEAYMFAGIGYAAIPPLEAFAKSRAAATRGLELDETLPETHSTRGFVAMMDWDFETSRRHLHRALELNPNHAAAHQWLAWLICCVEGDYAGAFKAWQRARSLDPLSTTLATETAWPFLYAELWDLALERLDRALELDANNGLARYNVGVALYRKGMFSEGIESLKRARVMLSDASFMMATLGCAYADSGDVASAKATLAELLSRVDTEFGLALPISSIFDSLGDAERALEWLEKAYKAHEPFMSALGARGWFEFRTIRGHPRFDRLIERIGVSNHDIPGQQRLLLAVSGS